MSKFPTADQPRRTRLNPDLFEAVKAVLRVLPKDDQTPELSNTSLEAHLKQQGIAAVRGSELDLVMEKLIHDGSIAARKSGIGHWYIGTINTKI